MEAELVVWRFIIFDATLLDGWQTVSGSGISFIISRKLSQKGVRIRYGGLRFPGN